MIRRGTYVLFLHFEGPVVREIGSLGEVALSAGDYCYVGSAGNGLDQRIGRHLSKEKSMRWHIDRLTTVCEEMFAYETEDPSIKECGLSKAMSRIGNGPSVKGFGCSDCDCATHLFSVFDVRATVRELERAGMVPFGDHRIG